MTALAQSRFTALSRGQPQFQFADPIAPGAIIYSRALCVLENGLLTPAKIGTGLVTRGVAVKTYDDSLNYPLSSQAVLAETINGQWAFYNDLDAPLTRLDIGKPCYILDDQTVSRDGAGRSVGGQVVDISADNLLVWVYLRGF